MSSWAALSWLMPQLEQSPQADILQTAAVGRTRLADNSTMLHNYRRVACSQDMVAGSHSSRTVPTRR